MNELKTKYANIILNSCLKLKANQPLFISANSLVSDFVRIVAEEAYKIGVKEIYFDITDPYLKHDALKNLSQSQLQNMQYWHKEKWNEYVKKGAAFLMLASEMPGLMRDIPVTKINEMTTYSLKTRSEFDDLRNQSKVPWCIAAVPTLEWAKLIFPQSPNPLNDLWNKIFEICLINKPNPVKLWDLKIEKLNNRCQKLNNYQFKKLHYQNSLGTDFYISLPKNHLWASGRELLQNGESILVNFPTEEVFTSPTANSAEGIVYSSKPLAYQDNIIDEFWFQFKEGKVISYGAKVGEENLKELLNSCPNINRLGEIALVENDSPISNSQLVFYETLFDENASCHLALGDSFSECLAGGLKMTKEELAQNNLNSCLNHVDFMIGTNDLKIIGITNDNQKIIIFNNGNFTEEFK